MLDRSSTAISSSLGHQLPSQATCHPYACGSGSAVGVKGEATGLRRETASQTRSRKRTSGLLPAAAAGALVSAYDSTTPV